MNINQLIKSLQVCVKSQIVPFIQGSPGIGKSDAVREIANKGKLELIDIRLSQCDPADLNGLPKLNGKRAEYLPFDFFPLEDDEVPEGMNGWLVFLDEINSASKSIQAAAYKLILDRMVGNHKLHDKVYVICAGNKDSDNAITNQISTALRSRFVTLPLEPDVDDWLKWAYDAGIDWRIQSFIRYQGLGGLYDFNPDKVDSAYACPRSWHMLSKLLVHIPGDQQGDYIELIRGTIGNQANMFNSFCGVVKDLPSIDEILSGRANKFGSNSGEKYLFSGFVINNAKLIDNETKAFNAVEYLDNIGKEYSMPFYALIKDNPGLLKYKAIKDKLKEVCKWLSN